MKKSIFLSVLALAAVVSCQKSEIVDSKYGNEAIGFETYAGRDAQTKAAVASDISSTAGIYGYYTAANKWDTNNPVTPASGFVSSPKSNLWVNGTLSNDGTVAPVKYWTNDTDYYSFIAYAPKDGAGLTVPTEAINVWSAEP